MSDLDEVRAWKDGDGDESTRQGHPAGDIDALRNLHGGVYFPDTWRFRTQGCCMSPGTTWFFC